MVFRRKKNTPANNDTLTGMRGRDSVEPGSASGHEPSQNPLARRFQADDEPETIDLIEPVRFHEHAEEQTDEDITRVLVETTAAGEASSNEILDDPIAGFLVVIEGPGRGSVSTVGYGINSIGRDASQRIALEFGDQQISRKAHCLITFDAVTSKFYVQAGEGRNLVYLNDEPVLAPTELVSGNHLRLGGTVLRFVPLCGDGFSWT